MDPLNVHDSIQTSDMYLPRKGAAPSQLCWTNQLSLDRSASSFCLFLLRPGYLTVLVRPKKSALYPLDGPAKSGYNIICSHPVSLQTEQAADKDKTGRWHKTTPHKMLLWLSR